MSTTIDQRVVEMRFDNQNFEKNVANSMSTLDKLKQKLNLTGASKGLEQVDRAARKVDMSGLGRGIETVSAKFSALQVIGTTALVNLTNSAMNAGKRMVEALTIDPIKTGLSEYETKINAIQVIQANTRGKNNMDDITSALDELNTYADKTIYNFAQMTSNIGKFTAQGFDVHQATNAVKGLANLAAASGASAEDMARATYQMSQALGSSIKLMDWNSLRNANMATQDLKNTLIALAKTHGIAIDEMIEKEGTFEYTLQKGWLSGEMFTEAMNIYSGVYTEAELAAKGFTEEQIANFMDLAKTAESAATEVKTFTQLWDVLKETAQSGWTQTWELLIGDFDSAKKMWTELQNYLGDIINGWSNARNFLIEGAVNISKPWKAIMEKLEFAGLDGIDEAMNKLDKYANLVEEIVNLDWGVGQERWDKLTEAGYDWAHAQNLVNEKLGNSKRYATDYAEAQDKVADAHGKTNESLNRLSNEQLRNAGLTEEEIRLYNALADEAEKSGRTIQEVVDEMQKNDGRTMLIDSLKNAWSGLLGIAKAVKGAFVEIFPPMTVVQLYNLIKGINEFSEKLRLTDKETGELTDTAQKLQRVFKGVFAIIDVVATIASGGLRIAFDLLSKVLGYFGTDVLTVAANIADAVVHFRDWAKSLIDVDAVLDRIVPPISKFVETIKEIVKAFVEMPEVQRIIEKITNAFSDLSKVKLFDLSKWSAVFWNISAFFPGADIFNGLSALLNTAATFGEDLANNIMDGFSKFSWSKISAVFWDISAALPNIPIFNQIAALANSMAAFFDGVDFKGIGINLTDGLVGGIIEGAANVIKAIITMATELISSFCAETGVHSPSTVFMAIGGFIIAGLILGIKDGLISVPETFRAIIDKVVGYIQGIDWRTLLALGISISALSFIKKLGDALINFSAPFEGLGDILSETSKVVESFGKVTKSIATNIKMKALKQLAIALAIMVGSVLAITLLVDDPLKLGLAVATIGVLAVILFGLSAAMDKMSAASINFNAKSKTIDFSGLKQNLLTIAAALLVVAGAIFMLGKLEPNEFKQGIAGLAVVIVGMAGLILALQAIAKLNKGKYAEGIENLGGLMIRLSIAMLAMVGVVKLAGKLSTTELAKGGVFVAAFLVFVSALALVTDGIKGDLKGLGSMLLKLSFAMMLMIGIVKLASLLKAGEMLKGAVFAFAFVKFVKGIVAAAKGAGKNIGKLGGMLVGLSIAMIALVGVCKLAGTLDKEEMLKGAGFATAFALFVKALVWATKGLGKNIGKLGGTLLALSVVIGVLAAISILLGMIPTKDLAQGIVAVGLLSTFMTMMIKSLKGTKEIRGTLIAMSVAIGILVAALVGLAFVPLDKLAKSTASLVLVLGAFATMIKVTHDSKNTKQMVRTLASLIIVVVLLAGIVAALSFIPNPMNALVAVGALSALMLTFASMIKILGSCGSIKETVSRQLTPMLIATGALAAILAMFTTVVGDKAVNAIPIAVAMGIFLNSFASSMAILGATKSINKGVVEKLDAMIAVAGGLGLILAIFTMVVGDKAVNAIPAAVAMGVFLNAFASSMLLLGLVQNVNVNGKQLIKMVGITALLGAIIAALSFIPNPMNALPSIAAISVLLAAMTGVMAALSLLNVNINNKILGSMAILGLIVAGLGAIIYGLSLIPNPSNSLTSVAAISILLSVMTGAITILSLLHVSINNKILGSLAIMEAIILGLGGIVAALSFIPNPANAIPSVVAISALLAVMTGLLPILSLIGRFLSKGMVAGIAGLTGMIIPLVAFGVGVSLIPDISGAKNNLIALSEVMVLMSVVLAAVSAVGTFLAAGIIPGILGLVAFIGAMAILVGAMGWLVDTFPSIQTWVDKGCPLLVQLANGIGDMIGAFVTSIGTSVTEGLVTMGENIAKLMESLKTASEHAKGIESGSFSGVSELVDALGAIALTAAGTQLADWFTIGGTTIDKFKKDALAFFDAMAEIAPKMAYAPLMEEFNSAGVIQLLTALSEIGQYAVVSQFYDLFTFGGTSMDKFKKDAGAFFEAMSGVGESAMNFSFPSDLNLDGLVSLLVAMKKVSGAMIGVSIADLFTFMAGDEGTMEKFEKDAIKFFQAVKAIAPEMKDAELPDEFNADGLVSLLDNLKKIAWSMTGMSFADLFAFMVGDEGTIEKFQKDGVGFFTAIKEIAKSMEGAVLPEDINVGNLEQLIDTLKTVGTKMAGEAWKDFFTPGDGTPIEQFKSQGVTFFTALKEMSVSAAGLSTDSFSLAEAVIDKIKSIITNLGGIDYSGVEEFTGIGTGGFGADGPMHDIGVALKDFGDQVSGLDPDVVSTAATVANKIKNLIANLVNLDTSGIENFKAKAVGQAIKDYSSQVKDIDPALISSSITSATRLKTFIGSLTELDSSGIVNFRVGSIGSTLKSYAESVGDLNITTVSSSIGAATKIKNFITSLVGIDISGVASYKTAINSLGTVSLDNFVKAFSVKLPDLNSMGGRMIDALVNGIKGKQSSLSSLANTLMTSLTTAINSRQSIMRNAGDSLMNNLLSGMNLKRSAIMNIINTMMSNMVDAISSKIAIFGDAGRLLITQLAHGITSGAPSVSSAATASLSSAVASIGNYTTSFYSAGVSLVDGFASGISANAWKAEAQASAMASAALAAAKEALGINSPSKEFYAIGNYSGLGFINALDDYVTTAYKAGSEMADSARSGLSDAINKAKTLIDGGIDVQPTIRPVLDLSEVRAGANSLGSLFGSGATVGVGTNLRAISSMMNSNQNGGNRDVVSAIEKLRKDMSEFGGDTYQINGITYDNGSAISDAIAQIARTALMERRI